MASPKFVNEPSDVPAQSLEGLLLSRPDLTVLKGAPNVVVPKAIPQGRVAVLCGGGSGHEPAHAGFVGEGWLTAAVCGGVFASPSHKSVLTAIRHLARENGNAGVLVLIKNYGGDVINFTAAATVAANETPHGHNVRTHVEAVVIGDDVAFGADHDAQRGIAGTVLLYKLLGAAAAAGYPLDRLRRLAVEWAPRVRSLGASLSGCAVPGQPPTTTLPAGTYELGLGIHGESGKERLPVEACSALVRRMVDLIAQPPPIDETKSKHHELGSGHAAPSAAWFTEDGERAVLFVNNLGATSDIEMNVVVADAVRAVRSRRGAVVDRLVTGRAMTALDMHGFSLTVLRLPHGEAGHDVLSLLDRPSPPGVGCFTVVEPAIDNVLSTSSNRDGNADAAADTPTIERLPADADEAFAQRARGLVRAAQRVAKAIAADESALNAFDAVVGDGDIGSGAARAAAAVIALAEAADTSSSKSSDAAAAARPDWFIGACAEQVADAFAGTSGPLLGGFLAAASTYARNAELTREAVAGALSAGTVAVRGIGKAAPGDRTMVDVLEPLVAEATRLAAGEGGGAADKAYFDALCSTAKDAAEAAKSLPAKKGRARYSNGREVGEAEPGCELVCRILTAVAEAATHA